MSKKTKYQTWIRLNRLITFFVIAIFFLSIALVPVNFYLRIFSVLLALPFIYITFILCYSYYQFASFGGNLQSKIHDLIINRLKWEGKGNLLDIGTGSGALIVKLAKAFPKSTFTGIDYWGKDWEYSKKQCQMNAEIEGVLDRVEFLKASAAELPFKDNEFDAVVSCLTFHEVKDKKEKKEVIIEALRVMKPGGEFVFLDLFMDERIFGEEKELLHAIKEQGISEVKIYKLDSIINLPKLLLNKKVLGNAMIMSGRK